jgi:hypothetical protein
VTPRVVEAAAEQLAALEPAVLAEMAVPVAAELAAAADTPTNSDPLSLAKRDASSASFASPPGSGAALLRAEHRPNSNTARLIRL